MLIFILNLVLFGVISVPLKCKSIYSFWGLRPQTPASEIHYTLLPVLVWSPNQEYLPTPMMSAFKYEQGSLESESLHARGTNECIVCRQRWN